ncbi:uncharacterized protein DSM5745_06796 [Aspergillus mulundensis]|uniref:Uncharacterized protein n=1 Tax=Aspergillus mulundensis TaxID=1810919 RepID=A0A3D8RSF0_9EURO|nr:hypothetical protein DSM5745_06796 [Aspergillus mulundensis]RDW76804.1 hypothetical protein DSM5745_06796 [Aspergillus mulundensis]
MPGEPDDIRRAAAKGAAKLLLQLQSPSFNDNEMNWLHRNLPELIRLSRQPEAWWRTQLGMRSAVNVEEKRLRCIDADAVPAGEGAMLAPSTARAEDVEQKSLEGAPRQEGALRDMDANDQATVATANAGGRSLEATCSPCPADAVHLPQSMVLALLLLGSLGWVLVGFLIGMVATFGVLYIAW